MSEKIESVIEDTFSVISEHQTKYGKVCAA